MELWLFLVLVQLALPLALLTLLMLYPFASRLVWASLLLATAMVLAALGVAGLWTIPPWWAWWMYVALWLLAVGRGVIRWRSWHALPLASWGRVGALSMALLGLWAADFALRAYVGTRPPQENLQAMRFPLADGTFLVVNGGNDIRVNAHLKVLDASEPHLASWRGNAHAVDLVAIDAWGRRANGLFLPSDLSAYRSQGWPVLAPCAGDVLVAVDGVGELQPPNIDPQAPPSGNHVLLACGDVQVLLAHFRRGSLRVTEGQTVVAGQPLGEVGNSGRSDEPHLHVHVQRAGTPDARFSGEPLAATFDGQYLVRGQRIRPSTSEMRR